MPVSQPTRYTHALRLTIGRKQLAEHKTAVDAVGLIALNNSLHGDFCACISPILKTCCARFRFGNPVHGRIASPPSPIDRPLPGEGDHEQEASSSCCWSLSHVPKYPASSTASVSRSKQSQGYIMTRTNYRSSLQHGLDGVNNRKSGQPSELPFTNAHHTNWALVSSQFSVTYPGSCCNGAAKKL